MSREFIEKQLPREIFHPEGLSSEQEKLAVMLFETPIQAKVRRRGSNKNFYEEVIDTHPFSIDLEKGFVQKHHEQFPDAPLSPLYINLRNLPSYVTDQIGIVLGETKVPSVPDVCSGIPDAATPLARSYSTQVNIETVDIFKKVQTDEGRKLMVSGDIQGEGKRIRLIDDVIGAGASKIEAITEAEKAGFHVDDILVLVDREEGGKEEMVKKGYVVHSSFSLTQLLEFYLRGGLIDLPDYRTVLHRLNVNKAFLEKARGS